MKRAKLGKGLGTLIDGSNDSFPDSQSGATGIEVREVPLAAITPNPQQPRQHFDDASIRELADSIAANGLVQPLLVQSAGGDQYTLIAGERRLRAYKHLGRETIPAIIRPDATPAQRLELALIENIQRQDLGIIERALAYQRLLVDGHLTQEAAAARLGVSRAAFANTVRLLTLPEKVLQLLTDGLLSEGHAKVLLQIPDSRAAADMAIETVRDNLSVRDLEILIHNAARDAGLRTLPGGVTVTPAPATFDTPYLRELEQRLTAHLGARVLIRVSKKNKYKGKFIIEFLHNDDFETILQKLGVQT